MNKWVDRSIYRTCDDGCHIVLIIFLNSKTVFPDNKTKILLFTQKLMTVIKSIISFVISNQVFENDFNIFIVRTFYDR